MPAPDLRALEAAIVADPEDPAGYIVYADALQARGDPRGELIALDALLAEEPDSKALTDARVDFLALHPELRTSQAVEWHYGFWRALYLVSGSAADAKHDAQLAELLASPSAKFLRALHLGSSFTPRVLESVARRGATLRELSVMLHPYGTFTNDDLAALAPLTELRRLSLSSCKPVTAAGLGALTTMHALERVLLRDCELTDDVAHVLGALPLKHVTFNAAVISEAGMRSLARAPLRRLYLIASHMDDVMVAPLAGQPTLVNLELHNAQLGPSTVAALGRIPRLRRLSLPSSFLDGSELLQLAPLAGQLESLGLNHSGRLTDPACRALAGFERLAFLDVAATGITGSGLRELCRIRSLENLDLSFLPLDDAALAGLGALGELRGLNLAYTQLTDRSINTLLRLPNLERLDLEGTQLTAAGLERLKVLPALTDLGLSDCDEEAIELAHSWAPWHVSSSLTLQDGLGQLAD